MFDEPIRSVMQRRNLLKAAPGTLVSRAAKLMAKRRVGAIMVAPDTVGPDLPFGYALLRM